MNHQPMVCSLLSLAALGYCIGSAKRLLKKSEQQVPRGLKPARNDKNKGLARRG
jgi:hypothetical protein